ncbi:hypothetical protein TVAG_453760 [Trichomonas vaginalis G3]|uniref:Anaphase-promoting complex subunit 4-like WD40 domain-containing protein n=1 Tax=Trichomonas vaginalis (strain ATCC PRA-98 / G3) TaxID=412133 RepID=A2DPV2_TRIV3|nr:WD40 repeat-like family [Trichomonas vaginalis G3]EAY17548.1 hypothetical protein TVAG_453760 [Trichomonas vaginalis G3]KAI5520592.1 WD40 repeat-like family [Trichomonas vaginalis G3]|eukprot:XP_001329683.1 hypothetical protein [Trichomonas vaginalis G3]
MEDLQPRVFSLKKDKPTCARFMYNDTYVAVGTENGRILILPLTNPNKRTDQDSGPINATMKKLRGHKKSITSMDIQFAKNILVTGSEDTTVAIWKGKDATVIRPNDGIIKFVSVSQANDLVLIAGEDGCPSVWNIETGDAVVLMKQFPSRVTAAAMAPNGKLFAVSTEENGCQLFDTNSGRPISQIPTPEVVSAISFSDESGLIALGCIDGQITVYDYKHHTIVVEKEVHYSKINSIALHPFDPILVSASQEGLHVSNPLNLIPRFSVEGEERIFQTISFSGSGNQYVTSATDKKLYLFETPTNEEMNPPENVSDNEVEEEQPAVEVMTPQVSYSTNFHLSIANEEDEQEANLSQPPEDANVKLMKIVIEKLFGLQEILDDMTKRIQVIDQQIARIQNFQKQRENE